MFAGSDVDLAAISPLFDTPASAMDEALASLDAEYGSVTAYLEQAAGLARDDLDALRANLLSPS